MEMEKERYMIETADMILRKNVILNREELEILIWIKKRRKEQRAKSKKRKGNEKSTKPLKLQ